MKTAEDALILTSLITGIGMIGKTFFKKNFSPDPGPDPRFSIEKFAIMAANVGLSIALKDYLQKEKYIPSKL